jgi:hypothetical protein
MIAATTWSWPGVANALQPLVLVDARGRKRRGTDVLLGRVPITFGIGPGFVEEESVDVAIALPAAAARESGCFVEATRNGRFMTERRIGDSVRAGQIGLAARGARIEPGDTLVEVDPGGVAHRCFGVTEGPRRIAEVVVAALAVRRGIGCEARFRDGADLTSAPTP